MSNGKINLTVVGNVVADPELRFTQSGTAVATFRVASTPKNFDKNTGQWVDGEATFLTCHAWRQLAENIADTLVKGMRVVVTGELQQRNYETRDGQRRTVMELNVDDVGPSLRFSVAQMVQPGREQDRQGFNPQPGGSAAGGWGSPAATGTDAPPF